uniref:non-specific serine/threonine protein kinase n=1 Tax=Chrysotila carterae TaxID=13221 RepID=A0A7S4EX39_CHRCT
MFQQLISGVEYCHGHMVVHRDLKPENLLLDSDQQLRIADFGLSNVMKARARGARWRGTRLARVGGRERGLCGTRGRIAQGNGRTHRRHAAGGLDLVLVRSRTESTARGPSAWHQMIACASSETSVADRPVCGVSARCAMRIVPLARGPFSPQDGDFFKTSCGSPNYAAPEVISGKLYAGPEVDVWSCGVILYALLCGSLPFDDENIPNLFKKIKGGIFTLPGHMSDDIKDLISRMLVVDPLQRITIPEIRRHRWFVDNLPLYLSVTPDQIMSQFRLIDQDVLMEVVMKIGFDREDLLQALQKQDRNQMTVAYYLILDNKRRKLLSSSPIMHATQAAAASAQEQAAAASAPQIHIPASRHGMSALPPAVNYAAQRAAAEHLQRRWHLGVQSSMAPADMMLEIFRALRVLRFEWKIVAQYSLKCRPCPQPPSQALDDHVAIDGSGLTARCKVKVGLQLYKIQEDSYLLDVRKVDGEILPFMDVCAMLLGELKL